MGEMRASDRHPRLSARLACCAVLAALAALGIVVQPASAIMPPGSAAAHVPLITLPRPPGTPLSRSAGSGAIRSKNWCGYAATSGPYISVRATWAQPAILATSEAGSNVAFWVGLDGTSDLNPTVEQIGIDCSWSGNRVTYFAWYEMFPAHAHPIPSSSITVHAGDVFTASITYGTDFTLTLTDQTTGKSFTTQQTLTVAQRLSAEIVAEASSNALGVLPLADFGLVAFSDCTVDGQPLSDSSPEVIDLVNSDGTWELAVPSVLGGDGENFSVATDHTPPSTIAGGLAANASLGWINHAQTVTLTSADNPGGFGVYPAYYTVDGGSTQTSAAPFAVSVAGSHVVTYWSVDNAGNIEPAHAGYVNIDTTAPTTRVDAATVKHERTVRLRCKVKDRPPSCGNAIVTLRIFQGNTLKKRLALGSCVTNAFFPTAWKCTLAKGSYTMKLYATDAAGNVQSKVGAATLTVK